MEICWFTSSCSTGLCFGCFMVAMVQHEPPEVARGSHHYTSELAGLSDGNIKATNVFIDSTGNPRLTDYGGVDLPRWVQSVVREEWTAEVFDLELMKCKDIEEEMVALLQSAMLCTFVVPDQHAKISNVLRMMDEIRELEEALRSHLYLLLLTEKCDNV